MTDISVEELARLSGRGRRSGIGLHGFEHGGLIVDGGRRNETDIPPLLARLPFPEDWSILVVRPPGESGLHGPDENRAFADLPPITQDVTDSLCRLVLLEILPAVVERDLAAFGAALSELQAKRRRLFRSGSRGHILDGTGAADRRRVAGRRVRRRRPELVGTDSLCLFVAVRTDELESTVDSDTPAIRPRSHSAVFLTTGSQSGSPVLDRRLTGCHAPSVRRARSDPHSLVPGLNAWLRIVRRVVPDRAGPARSRAFARPTRYSRSICDDEVRENQPVCGTLAGVGRLACPGRHVWALATRLPGSRSSRSSRENPSASSSQARTMSWSSGRHGADRAKQASRI